MSQPEPPQPADKIVALPRLPGEDGPVFAEPWQAQAFALAVELSAAGAFTWPQWAQALAAELASDPDDDGARYYEHWVAALERFIAHRNLLDLPEMAARKTDWAAAYRNTPHGRPVELAAAHDHGA